MIGDDGVAVAKIPELSGVDKMAIDNWVRILVKCGYVGVATGSWRSGATSGPVDSQRGSSPLRLLPVDGVPRGSLARRPIVGSGPAPYGGLPSKSSGSGPGSPLWKGTEPDPDGWRSETPSRQALPHFPVVTVRGGFPDGS